MKVLVTGGAGFIGSWVVDALIRESHQVAVVDNFATGQIDNLHTDAQLFRGDICDSEWLKEVFDEFKPDVVNHHAAQVNVRISAQRPSEDAATNILGTLHLLQHAAANKVKRFIFASTGGAIYGEAKQIPTPETAPTEPTSPYGVAKLSSEHYLRAFGHMHALPWVILRYANVYGPRQNAKGEAGVVAVFCKRALQQETCIVFGDGKQTRDYVYVEDVARANILALNTPQAQKSVFNIGTGEQHDVYQLVDKLGLALNQTLRTENAPSRAEEILHSALDSSKALQQLGWQAQTDLSEGLARTAAWFQHQQST